MTSCIPVDHLVTFLCQCLSYWDFYLAPNGFNLIFTSFPVLFLICLDRPYSREVAKLCPEIYMRDEFNLYLFYYNFWRAMVNSAIIFCICTYMTDGAPFKDGQTADLVASYTTTFTAVLSNKYMTRRGVVLGCVSSLGTYMTVVSLQIIFCVSCGFSANHARIYNLAQSYNRFLCSILGFLVPN